MYMKEEATTKINTLSLHDALPIYIRNVGRAEEGRDVFNETLAFAHGCVRVKGVAETVFGFYAGAMGINKERVVIREAAAGRDDAHFGRLPKIQIIVAFALD